MINSGMWLNVSSGNGVGKDWELLLSGDISGDGSLSRNRETRSESTATVRSTVRLNMTRPWSDCSCAVPAATLAVASTAFRATTPRSEYSNWEV